ncbi:MAG: hypothetical protein JSW39_04450 [Desulfobacterales bacterium]|nr:MAG: hypothetical protein JSW39_04450 [Desulfobacterales bacterium]
MVTKFRFALILAGVLLFGFGQTVQADLALIGPIDPVTGFPSFVQDADNVQLGPCDRIEPVFDVDGVTIINNFPCPGTELVDPGTVGGTPGAFVDGNILEFTYYRAEANFAPTADIKNFRLRIEVQGGVLPPVSINNAVRLVMTFNPNAPQGTYTIFHPFGSQQVEVTQAEIDTRLDMELDGGVLGIFPALDAARAGNVQCFWSNGTATVVDGMSFFGDALTAAPLVPATNAATCPQGPADGDPLTAGDLEFGVLFPDGTTAFSTDLFTVEGKLAPELGFLIDRATYERNAAGTLARADLWLSSIPAQNIVVSAGTAQLRGPATRIMLEDAANPGRYYLRQRLDEAAGIPLPPNPITLLINGEETRLVDEVRITQAIHNVNTDTVTINVSSSDAINVGGPTFEFRDEFGNLVPPAGAVPPNAALREITATSSAGGSDTEDVDVRGGNIFQ